MTPMPSEQGEQGEKGLAAVLYAMCTISPSRMALDIRMVTRPGRLAAATLGIALVGGAVVRVAPIAGIHYPLGLGGLFYAATLEFESLPPGRLPLSIPNYGTGELAFVYPPLGFIVLAALQSVSRIPTLEFLRIAPALISVVALLSFALLARVLFADSLAAACSTLCYAFSPATFAELIDGAGGVRGVATVASLCGLSAYVLANRSEGKKRILLCALAAVATGAALLTHPVIGLFTVVAPGIWGFVESLQERRTKYLTNAVIVGLGSLIVSSPWWLLILLRYGAQPLVFAFGSRTTPQVLLGNLQFNPTGERFVAVIASASLVGLAYAIVSRRYDLALWFTITILGFQFSAVRAEVAAVMAGLGLGDLLVPVLLRWNSVQEQRLERGLLAIFGGAMCCYVVAGALLLSVRPDTPFVGRALGDAGLNSTLSDDNLATMEWLRQNVSPQFPQASAIVVAPEREWFPALAGMRSVNVAEGSEWIGQFQQRTALNTSLYAAKSYADLVRIGRQADDKVAFVYVEKPSRYADESQLNCLERVYESQTRLVFHLAGQASCA